MATLQNDIEDDWSYEPVLEYVDDPRDFDEQVEELQLGIYLWELQNEQE